MYETILTPVLAMIVWTLVMWLWMYATRIPAMQKAGINAAKMTSKSEMDVLPVEVRRIADNYNHLHEQPTIFYALVVYCYLVGLADPLMIGLAWGYVALRVLHSLIQALWNFIPVRFFVFISSSIVLIVMSVRAVIALF
ncbi:MAPEG family protein [uncultured Maricaulis sp.]|uniref:MAPEG family protein n=1 Tax=uncultured Maricaulis sp. TaxID=174710 RepID=UPI0030DDC9DC|tara:strand:+ start:8385 stop:8801 length:417 start_codon:yes stop_codon:yes gene_type:complete